MKLIGFIMLIVFNFIADSVAENLADNWFLPVTLSDQNTKVRFELDSTWHMVHGIVKNISGSAKLKDLSDKSSVSLLVRFPVRSFNTDNRSRDKELRHVMGTEEFPDVIFEADRLLDGCTPERVAAEMTCADLLESALTIRGVRKLVRVPIIIAFNNSKFTIKGSLPIRWSEFGVEDPSILIARVDPIVTVHFEAELAGSAAEVSQ